jgi:outer membrane protein assembly factor BamB
MNTRFAFLSLLIATSAHADWPQWRGPDRNGVSSDTTPIVSALPPEGFKKVWESGTIPSDHYGGHGSPVVQGERVFLSVVWHERVPSDSREIDTETMQKLNTRGVPKDLEDKMEAARESLNPRLRGEKLDAWIAEWNKANLTPEQQVSLGSWVASRFKAGPAAIPMKWLNKLAAKQDKPFPTAQAFKDWLDTEGFPPDLKQKVYDLVPNTIKVAKDVVLCLDFNTGKELWKWEQQGEPTGRKSSSTCAIVDGRVYAMLSTELVCVNEADGKLLWKAKLAGKGPGSSPLVIDGKVICNAGTTAAFDAKSGTQLWSQKDARGDTTSPTWWTPSTSKPAIVVQTSNKLLGLKPEDGSIAWEAEGGGQSTPVASGDWLVIYSSAKGVGLRAYKADDEGKPKVAWSHYWLTLRYTGSPIVHDGLVYNMCGGKHLCFELETGKQRWEEVINSTISSPLLVDGKILIQENNGTHIRLVKADGTSYQMLARAKADAMGCASPAVSNGRLFVRQKDKLVCFDLRPAQ